MIMRDQSAPSPSAGPVVGVATVVGRIHRAFAGIPHSVIAAIARFSIAAIFWKSGQTKIEGFAIDVVDRTFTIGMPRFADSTIDLFRDEYRLPLLPPEIAALFATVAEHVFPILLLLGLATRLSAFALLGMTLVIQFLVYPGAYPVHGVWAVVLLYLMAHGPGVISVDAALTRHFR